MQVAFKTCWVLAAILTAAGSIAHAQSANYSYVVINGNDSLGLVSIPAGGGSIKSIAPNVSGEGIVVDAAGNFIVAQDNLPNGSKLLRLTPAGVVTTIAQSTSATSSWDNLTMDAAGNFIIGDNRLHAILRVSPTGSSITTVAAYPVECAEDLEDIHIAVDGTGNYVFMQDNAACGKTPKRTCTASPLPER